MDNRKNNRYRDVNPYDHSRILLARIAAADTDYINANLVKCDRAARQYILTQGPLPLTVSFVCNTCEISSLLASSQNSWKPSTGIICLFLIRRSLTSG